MANKEDFSPQEWLILTEAPLKAAIAVILASPSGPIGLIQESLALRIAIEELAKRGSPDPLMNEIAENYKTTMDEKNGEQNVEMPAGLDVDEMPRNSAEAKQQAINAGRKAIDILKSKTALEDVNAYRDFFMSVAVRVADAAKEGSFLGFGGKRISDAEQTLLDDLKAALNV